jgi:cysteine desulfurase
VEHPAVLEAARAAQRAGREVRVLGVGPDGLVDLDQMRQLVDRGVALVSVQSVNHETGVIQPVGEIGRRVRRWAPAAVFHTDAVQAAPWMDLREVTATADLVSISGHKIGGPQGIGALGIRNGTDVAPLMYGGGQERERRSGTPNVAAIVGLAAAVEVLQRSSGSDVAAVEERRDLLVQLVLASVPDAVLTAPRTPKVPGHCHFRFPGLESETLLFLLDERGICASAGAACASGAIEASPVLLAMGVDKDEAASSLRLTLGPTTTEPDVRLAAGVVADAVGALRGA